MLIALTYFNPKILYEITPDLLITLDKKSDSRSKRVKYVNKYLTIIPDESS